MEKFDVVIIGGGPGGLSCASVLAGAGARVLLLERKKDIGRKVCAGGITWHGFIRQVPEHLIQRTFTEQYIFSNRQRVCYRSDNPIIATVDRQELGQWMRDVAVSQGADVRPGWYVRSIDGQSVTGVDENGNSFTLGFDHLVGADGSSSLVRRHLGIPSAKMGVGINFQIPGDYARMEWHLNTETFGRGYGWIFPHRDTLSVGAYTTRGTINPDRLKRRLVAWAGIRGFELDNHFARAEFINYDFRGFEFGNTWLVGDAAGLASGLTGEGINPAIVSGEEVAKKIIDHAYSPVRLSGVIKKQRKHARLVALASSSKPLCAILMETIVAMLRLNLIDLQKKLSM